MYMLKIRSLKWVKLKRLTDRREFRDSLEFCFLYENKSIKCLIVKEIHRDINK